MYKRKIGHKKYIWIQIILKEFQLFMPVEFKIIKIYFNNFYAHLENNIIFMMNFYIYKIYIIMLHANELYPKFHKY